MTDFLASFTASMSGVHELAAGFFLLFGVSALAQRKREAQPVYIARTIQPPPRTRSGSSRP